MQEVTSDKDFVKIIKENKKVLVDFYADWCAPCKKLYPKLVELSKKHPDVKFVKVNVDDLEELSEKYGVDVMPTILTFSNGKANVDTKVEGDNLNKITAAIEDM